MCFSLSCSFSSSSWLTHTAAAQQHSKKAEFVSTFAISLPGFARTKLGQFSHQFLRLWRRVHLKSLRSSNTFCPSFHHELARLRRQAAPGFGFRQPRRNHRHRRFIVGQICSFQCNYLTVFFVFTLCQFRLYFGIRIVVCKCAELALRRGCVSCNVNQETRQSPYMGTVLAKFFLPFSPLPDYLLVIWEI